MKRYIQYEPFNIYCFETEKWQHPVHNHTYSEIIFIRKGNGKHIINGNVFNYSEGDVFLLGPEDYHTFDIEISTDFFYIRFTEDFIKASESQKGWQNSIEFLLKSTSQTTGSIVKAEDDKKALGHLLSVLLFEYDNRQKGSYEVMIDSLMKAILTILARNIIKDKEDPALKNQYPKSVEELLIYIRQNIYQPKNLRIDQMASNFNYSANYLSIYFKKQTGQSLQQYILKYKLKLIEDRLLFSEFNISQIADEFGFTDVSHFHKVFRKHYGVAPKDYRINNLQS